MSTEVALISIWQDGYRWWREDQVLAMMESVGVKSYQQARADEREKARTRVAWLTYWVDYSIADEQRIVSLEEVFAAIADDRSLWEDQGVPAPWTKDGIEHYYGEQP